MPLSSYPFPKCFITNNQSFQGCAPASARRQVPAKRLELWELWGIMGNYGELWWNYGELWGIMGNYGGIMGNYGELWGGHWESWAIMGELWWNYGELWGIWVELWGIMGNYG